MSRGRRRIHGSPAVCCRSNEQLWVSQSRRLCKASLVDPKKVLFKRSYAPKQHGTSQEEWNSFQLGMSRGRRYSTEVLKKQKQKNNGNICWQTSISQYKGLAKGIETSNATDTDAKSAKNKETHRVQVQGQLGLDIGGKRESILCNGSFHFPSFSPFIVGSDATTPCRWHWWLGTSDDKKWRVEWIVTKHVLRLLAGLAEQKTHQNIQYQKTFCSSAERVHSLHDHCWTAQAHVTQQPTWTKLKKKIYRFFTYFRKFHMKNVLVKATLGIRFFFILTSLTFFKSQEECRAMKQQTLQYKQP